MIKLFISDIDHTLYSSELGCIPEENMKAIREMMDQGIVICLATSRIYNGLVETALELGMDKTLSYGVGFNGALTKRFNDGKVLCSMPFEKEDVEYLKNFSFENNVSLMVYQNNCYISNAYTGIVDYNFVHVKSDIILTNDFDKYITDPVYQLAFSDDRADMYALAKEIDEKTGHRFNVNNAQPIVIDFSLKTVSKLYGLQQVIKDMGITLDEVAALGDGDNDAPMLEAAGLSGCVGNGSQLAKESADYVLKPCREAGAAEFINKYILNRQ